MKSRWNVFLAAVFSVVAVASTAVCEDSSAVALPSGVRAVWDMGKAYHETTPTRESICINGLWQWQPARDKSDEPPKGNWGYFKVPGCWPGTNDWQQHDSQTVFTHPSWKGEQIRSVNVAWYQREITVPKTWAGRRIAITTKYLNSRATVFIDGKKIGEMVFPAGEIDLTEACTPGSKHVLSLHVAAVSRRGPAQVLLRPTDGGRAGNLGEAARLVRRRIPGQHADCARIADVKVDPSVRKAEITFDTSLKDLAAGTQYTLQSVITEKGKKVAEFTSKPFTAAELKNGRIKVTEKWKAEKLWDINTPQNTYEVALSLLGADQKVLDAAAAVCFGFRELWIDGRDFYLNGTRIYLSCNPMESPSIGATMACYEGAKEEFCG